MIDEEIVKVTLAECPTVVQLSAREGSSHTLMHLTLWNRMRCLSPSPKFADTKEVVNKKLESGFLAEEVVLEFGENGDSLRLVYVPGAEPAPLPTLKSRAQLLFNSRRGARVFHLNEGRRKLFEAEMLFAHYLLAHPSEDSHDVHMRQVLVWLEHGLEAYEERGIRG